MINVGGHESRELGGGDGGFGVGGRWECVDVEEAFVGVGGGMCEGVLCFVE